MQPLLDAICKIYGISTRDMAMRILFLLLLIAPPGDQHVNLLIRGDCLKEPVVLVDCDLNYTPAHCKQVKVHYRESCAEIVVTR